jgi:hypothetical protein
LADRLVNLPGRELRKNPGIGQRRHRLEVDDVPLFRVSLTKPQLPNSPFKFGVAQIFGCLARDCGVGRIEPFVPRAIR